MKKEKPENPAMRNKFNKLYTLLNDVKKHNKESHNVVYTIKKKKKSVAKE